jgi:iron complex outermembrane receptor protein/outer membrane receptor for ferrienterochelin and colicins
MKKLLLYLSLLFAVPLFSQQTVILLFTDSASGESLPGVVVLRDGKGIAAADTSGKARVAIEAPANLSFHMAGYFTRTMLVNGNESAIQVKLVSLSPELEAVTIQSTRNNSRIEDAPTKTEVLGQEELEEENGIRPGNVCSLLGDISSIQIQNTGAVSGQSTVRIQGLDGRYTQILRDGLPVYNGFASGFSIMQLPPLDLKQIELIKGPASTLYGGGAIGGLVNFVSRMPADSNEHSVTANLTTLSEINFNYWSSGHYKNGIGHSFMAAVNIAAPVDVNKDSFSDVPAVTMLMLHPRLYFTPGKNNTLTLGLDATAEQRLGGDLYVLNTGNDSSGRFFEKNSLRRGTTELLFHHKFSDSLAFDLRGSTTLFDRSQKTEGGRFDGTQHLQYAEASITAARKKQTLVLGMNLFNSRFNQGAPVHQPVLNEQQLTLGIFLQSTYTFTPKLILEAGVRTDRVKTDTTTAAFLLPRIAFLWKWNNRTGMRITAGMGYVMPSTLMLMPDEHYLPVYIFPRHLSLTAENSIGGATDVYWRRKISEELVLYMNQSFFFTQVDQPLVSAEAAGDSVHIYNAGSPLLTYGSDSYIRLASEDLEFYLGYTYTRAQRRYDETHPYLPVTPVHRVSFVALYELPHGWKFVAEGSVIGHQYREDGTKTPPYFIGALMVGKDWRRMSVVLNCENIAGVLQSDYEPLYTGAPLQPHFNPLWAPVDGRVLNLSARYRW